MCRCKFREYPGDHKNIVDLAKPGDRVIGTGGADLRKSAGHGKLVYAMRVEEKLTRERYFKDERFEAKKPITKGSYERQRGDNEPPGSPFERHGQSVLISRDHFYYFGRKAVLIPKRFADLEKKGPGFKRNFSAAFVEQFARWITTKKPGRHGEPCKRELLERRKTRACK